LLARAGTPQPVLDKLAAAAIGALKEPKVREVLGGRSDRPAEFREFIRSESAKYAKIVEITGITLK
jgi:tripartite-type tricarboxylate transporter receptor subunit TctC